MSILVRNSIADDALRVYELLKIIAQLHVDGRPDMHPGLESKYTLDEVRDRLTRENNGVFVAVDNNIVAGYIFCQVIKEGIGDTLYIDDLCVDPSARKHGIGTALMDRAVAYAKELNCRQVMLNVWEFNSTAVSFYENYGFKTRTRHMEIDII